MTWLHLRLLLAAVNPTCSVERLRHLESASIPWIRTSEMNLCFYTKHKVTTLDKHQHHRPLSPDLVLEDIVVDPSDRFSTSFVGELREKTDVR
jgi:hypothetical protein